MKILSSTKKILITVIILNMISFGIFFFLMAVIKYENDKVTSLKIDLDNINKIDDSLREMRGILKETSEGRKKLDSFFIEGGDNEGFANFIKEIEDLGLSNNIVVEVGSVKINDGVSDDFEHIILNASFEGSWSDVLRFISMVENMPYSLNIGDVNFSSGEVAEKIPEAGEEEGVFDEAAKVEWSGSFDIDVLKFK